MAPYSIALSLNEYRMQGSKSLPVNWILTVRNILQTIEQNQFQSSETCKQTDNLETEIF